MGPGPGTWGPIQPTDWHCASYLAHGAKKLSTSGLSCQMDVYGVYTILDPRCSDTMCQKKKRKKKYKSGIEILYALLIVWDRCISLLKSRVEAVFSALLMNFHILVFWVAFYSFLGT